MKKEVNRLNVIVIGGGAAGFFGAVAAAGNGHKVTILEATSSVLAKVKISGGGRCNVTHACFEPAELVKAYPRGGRALRGPLTRFQPADTVAWFQSRGVTLKTEVDGRMFPVTDDSSTIVDCLQDAARRLDVTVRTGANVRSISEPMRVTLRTGEEIDADRVLLATGGNRPGFELARSLGHTIVPPVPSLFTFNVQDARLQGLQGVSVEDAHCSLYVSENKFTHSGSVLVTHWGLSGPVVLRLSAFAARELFNASYSAILRINWLSNSSLDQVRRELEAAKRKHAKKAIDNLCPFLLPKRLWQSIVGHALRSGPRRWADLSRKGTLALATELTDGEFQVHGKGVFKEEFVTCGGVDLKEVDFRTMQSRVSPGLFLAGEVLDVDGITGGFNFQNAWTTAWIAGNSL